MVILNDTLVAKQGLSDEQKQKLHILYKQLDDIFEYCASTPEDSLAEIGESITETIKNIEFQLQEAWNFDKDPLKHAWWNKAPKCKCPKLDNDERFGFGKYINCTCPIHKHMCHEDDRS